MTTYEMHDSLTFKPYSPEEMARELRYTVTVHITTEDNEEFLSNPLFVTTDDADHADFIAYVLLTHYAFTLRRCISAMGLSPSRARKCIFMLYCTDNESGEFLWEEQL